MNVLAGREHSIQELRQKLERKKYSCSLIDNVIKLLIEENILSEERFVESFVQSRINRGFGPVKIRHDLFVRGIDNGLMEQYIDGSFEFWMPHIERVRKKRFGGVLPTDFREQARQARYLYQRGFDAEMIRKLW